MSVSQTSGPSRTAADGDRQIAVMKKARDIQKDTAQALVDLVKQAAPMPDHIGTRLNVVA